jgi:hypothetical protein
MKTNLMPTMIRDRFVGLKEWRNAAWTNPYTSAVADATAANIQLYFHNYN